MPTFTVTKVKPAGQKPNPHGGTLYKFYVALTDESGNVHGDPDDNTGVYWQRKSPDLAVGEQVHGNIEQGEYGPRFKTEAQPGNFQRPATLTPPAQGGFDPQAERSRRIERQHSQHMALLFWAAVDHEMQPPLPEYLDRILKPLIDWFAQDLDADVGGGNPRRNQAEVAKESDTAAADVNADAGDGGGSGSDHATAAPSAEASPAQKRLLTTLFNQAQIAREAQKAIVLYRCRSEKATKDGASQLIQDLQDGATHDQLIAEVYDAHRAGNNPLATRAVQMIPTEVPWTDDESLPPAPEKEGEVPF